MSDNKVLASLADLLSRTTGRDKLCRVVQYATRFLAAHKRDKALSTPVKEELIGSAVRMEQLGSAMAMTRKLLRFGRQIDLILQIKKTIEDIESNKIQNVPKSIVKVLSQICLCLFFLFDHILFFAKLGWIQDPKTIAHSDFLSNLFWFLQCIFSLIKCGFDKVDMSSKSVSFSEKKALKKEFPLEVARNLLDLPVAYGFMYPGTVSNKVMGILGTVTSVIGVVQNWR